MCSHVPEISNVDVYYFDIKRISDEFVLSLTGILK